MRCRCLRQPLEQPHDVIARHSDQAAGERQSVDVRSGARRLFEGGPERVEVLLSGASASYGADVSGIALLVHPSNPGFPQPWILRQRNSMQNPVFPGRHAVELPTEEPLVLRYRLLIHRGAARPGDLAAWHADYVAAD